MSEDQRILQEVNVMDIRCVSKEDIYKDLVRYFKPYVSVSPLDWGCIKKSMSFFAPIFMFKELIYLYFDYIFSLFEDYRITDREVTHFCVTRYCRYKMNFSGFPMTEPDGTHISFEPVNHDYGVPRYEYFVMPRYLDTLLSRPFMYQDPATVRRILRYVAPLDVVHRDLHNYLTHILLEIRKDPFLVRHVNYMHWTPKGEHGQRHHEVVGGRRIKLVLMAVDFLLQVRIGAGQEAIQLFRLFLLTLPDPQVTWQEILGFLNSRVKVVPRESKRRYIEKFLETSMVFFPECMQNLKPRTLKHLAKCKVRGYLGRARTLPHGVWSLGLPRELENYVLLQTHKDQFRPVIGPLSSERKFVLKPVPNNRESLGPSQS